MCGHLRYGLGLCVHVLRESLAWGRVCVSVCVVRLSVTDCGKDLHGDVSVDVCVCV